MRNYTSTSTSGPLSFVPDETFVLRLCLCILFKALAIRISFIYLCDLTFFLISSPIIKYFPADLIILRLQG